MKTTCYDCELFPMCKLYSKLIKVFQEDSVISNSHLIFERISENCKYFKGGRNERKHYDSIVS